MLLFALLDFFLSLKISEKTVLFLVHFRANTDRWPIAKVRLIRAAKSAKSKQSFTHLHQVNLQKLC